MKLKLDINKSIEQNAEVYFEKAKKFKKKLAGAEKALKRSFKRLEELKEKKEKILLMEEKEKTEAAEKREKKWYEKFHWFVSSEGFLCIGGRDATSNEIVVKKHVDKDDVVFHTDMAGSPFFIVKSEGKKIGEETLKETAEATASYSKAWKVGVPSTDVFYVNPEQVTKEAKPGEFMPKGAFMVYGKKNYIKGVELRISVGVKEGQVIGGPVNAIKKDSDKYVVVEQGDEKTGELAKKIAKTLNTKNLDEIIRFLPAGGGKIKK